MMMMIDEGFGSMIIVEDRRYCFDVISFNPFKPSGVKWLHYKVFKAILV